MRHEVGVIHFFPQRNENENTWREIRHGKKHA